MTQRTDVCPECGDSRTELVVVPGRFFCPSCGVAGDGPNEAAGSGAQLALETLGIARAIEAQGRTRPDIVLGKARELERRDWPTRLAGGEPSIEDCLADGDLYRQHIEPYGRIT